MTDLRTAAQQALEALEAIDEDPHGTHSFPALSNDAITALKAALAQQEQEPVAWMVYTQDGKSVCVTDNPADFTDEHRALPLYTHPPRREWVSLTEEERVKIIEFGSTLADIARAIEQACKERNT
jgi:hypothetical protein